MYRNFLLLLFISLLQLNVAAQIFKRQILWSKDSKEKHLQKDGLADKNNGMPFYWFESAIYPNPKTMLPCHFELIALPASIVDVDQLSVSITNQLYQSLDENDGISINEIEVENQPEPIFAVKISRKVSYLEVTIPAIRINQQTGLAEKLASFEIQVNILKENVSKRVAQQTANQSVLRNGSWVKIKVSKTGVYRISYSEIQSMGLTNPENVTLWGHGGRQLPFLNSQPSSDDLNQIPIWMEKGSDNTFNQGDFILFYAEGPVAWNYNAETSLFTHTIHDYSEYIYYFLTTDQPNIQRISTISDAGLEANSSTSAFDALVYFERNDTNFIKSGRQWFGETFDVYSTRTYSTGFSKPVSSGMAKVTARVAARSSVSSSFTVKANGTLLGSISQASASIGNDYSDFVSQSEKTFNYPYTSGNLELELTYSKPTPASKSWLDYITVSARQQLWFTEQQLLFRDTESVGEGKVTTFNLENVQSSLMVWDVTNFFEPVNISLSTQGSAASFKRETNFLREFVAFLPTQVFSVDVVGSLANQNIHGEIQPEMVIVAHPSFIDQAQELANVHNQHDGTNALVVTTDQVYNEFSSGTPDVSSIRNMMRMFYNRSVSEEDMPKHLLLFGDGSYDNRGDRSVNTNYILTYQSQNSVNKQYSFVTDDFFGLLDENEGEADGLLDIGIGRIPCSSKAEADVAVGKVRQYLDLSSTGSWHNQLCFIGDDEDGNLHMRQADELARLVESTFPRYNIEKIFFDAFPQVSTTQGNRYPEVNNAINNRFNQGALIVNYTGHANPMWLSEEKVLMISDIQSWRNFERLPLFVTATCEFSRFDDFSRKSAGEHVLFSPSGGGVGLISTTRIVYASSNHVLNMNFYRFVFNENAHEQISKQNRYNSLGEVLRLTKINSGSGYNKRSFMLLGDPALTLHYPSYGLAITSINSKPVGSELDTLKALSKVTIQGTASDFKTNSDFSPEAEVTMFDKEKEITTLANDGGIPFLYKTRENVIYRGRSSLNGYNFETSFIVPKDIMYSFGSGRFSLFAKSDAETGSGYFEDFIVGGISDNLGDDTAGPEIGIYLNDKNFVSGGITDASPKLLAFLTDSSGINTTGTGIGHDLVATLTGENENSFILNDYYVTELNSYQEGKVEYQFTDLKPGKYSLKVKVWDVYNNSSEAEIDFTIKLDNKFELTHVLNYPNPFTETTAFFFEHNQPYEDFDVKIQIFSPSGKLVKTIDYFYQSAGTYRVGPIYWDGLDDFGDRIGRGVYFYRLKARQSNGKAVEKMEKLVILK